MDRERRSSEEASEVNESSAPVASSSKKGGFGKKPVAEIVNIAAPKIAQVRLTLVGTSPLIMHRFSNKGGLEAMRIKQLQIGDTNKKKRDAKNPLELFVAAAHVMPGAPAPKVKGTLEDFLKGVADGEEGENNHRVTMSGKFCVPFSYLKGAIETAATDTVGITKAAVKRNIHISEAWVPLKGSDPFMREDLVRLSDMNRTADIRYRPQFDTWELTFSVNFNEGVVNANTVCNLFETAGFNSGLGEWRAEKGGVFGAFKVKQGTSK